MSDVNDVKYAIMGSLRYDRDGHGNRCESVGFDVFAITGHITVGETTYLTLKSTGWVRNKENLLHMHMVTEPCQ